LSILTTTTMTWQDIVSYTSSDPIVWAGAAAATTVGAIALGTWWTYSKRKTNETSPTDATTLPKPRTIPPPLPATVVPLSEDDHNNVWAARRKQGIATASGPVKRTITDKAHKPFGSTYYYAHNNTHKHKGGYSDGLSMEDFTMNQPRLLGRVGGPTTAAADNETKPTIDDGTTHAQGSPSMNDTNETSVSDNNAASPSSPSSEHNVSAVPALPTKCIRDITRYLWDDPADPSGKATLRIEQVPGRLSTETIPWSDASVHDIDAQVVDQGTGLRVTIATTGDFDYRLYLQPLYGTLESVQAVSKSKRLLLKLQKTKARGNAKAWPHPHKKKV
jgi:hypothetical protein